MPCSYKKTESTSGDDADKHLQLSSIIWLSVGADKHYILITVCRCRQCPAPTRRPSPHQVLVLTNTCRDEPDFQLSEGTDSTPVALDAMKKLTLHVCCQFFNCLRVQTVLQKN